MVYILRNNQKYGPYDDNALVTYVNSGQLLMVDSLEDDSTGEITTVRKYINRHNLKVKIQHGGSFANQLNKIGTELLVPKDAFKKKSIITDTRLILLGLVGLVPSILMFLPNAKNVPINRPTTVPTTAKISVVISPFKNMEK